MLKIIAYLGKRLHDGLSKPHPGAISFKGLHSSTIALALRAAMPPLAFSSAWPHTHAALCVQACRCTRSGPALAQPCTCEYLRACQIQFWMDSCLHTVSR